MSKQWLIEGETGDWEVVVGMEVHAQVISKSKLFSPASAEYGAMPNEHVDYVDVALPGALPVLNEECVKQGIRTGFGLKAKINKYSRFDRKNYFYADLPQGYQISQFYYPIVGEGAVQIDLPDNEEKTIRVTRMHLEQDAGKSMHDQDPELSYIDFNRAGVALMEIVSEPDIRSPEEGGAYLRKIRQIVRYMGTCDGNMEEGSMRADVNVSVRKVGEKGYRTRCEIKNVNSIRYVMQAIEIEARRQVDIYEEGGEVDQETRTFDPHKGETRTLRSKEEAEDYRYFPDPDLRAVELTDEFIAEIKASLPEMPDDKRKRLEEEYKLTRYESGVLTAEVESADFFEKVAKGHDPRLAANWVLGDFFGLLNKAGKDISTSPISAERLGELLALIEKKTINGKIAKEVLEIMAETGDAPAKIVKDKGLEQVTDTGAIEKVVNDVIANNPENVKSYKEGKDRLFGFFVGQVMKEMKGKANPAVVNELLKKALG